MPQWEVNERTIFDNRRVGRSAKLDAWNEGSDGVVASGPGLAAVGVGRAVGGWEALGGAASDRTRRAVAAALDPFGTRFARKIKTSPNERTNETFQRMQRVLFLDLAQSDGRIGRRSVPRYTLPRARGKRNRRIKKADGRGKALAASRKPK